MHELFANVLAKRDLSRAGELFSIEDSKIVNDLSDVVSRRSWIRFQERFSNTFNLLTASWNFHDHRSATVP